MQREERMAYRGCAAVAGIRQFVVRLEGRVVVWQAVLL